ncbi:hypothetical protein HELRODRAFT_192653 [Helobdella robusta]|uniref:FAR1 domain-containing protein n=1 Tax=Helobdella robusta TaxID=6412 RepID=T1FU58_HELRO|nr:hypothetical protein HELRODRAFT_192653 [Helobdella robusta]ESN99931.1 hypothetical protein HELRODRAFT_192653 [Helobdella robusta]
MPNEIRQDQCFPDIEMAIDTIENYLAANFQPMKRDSKESVRNFNNKCRCEKAKIVDLKPEDQYGQRWICKHYGDARKSPEEKIRIRKKKSYRCKCSARIYVAYCKIRKQYVVKTLSLEHNHPVDEKMYASYPANRQPKDEVLHKAKEMLKEGVRPKHVVSYLHQSNCPVTGKDVYNMKQRIRIKHQWDTQQKRLKVAMVTCAGIASALSELPPEKFSRALTWLRAIEREAADRSWKNISRKQRMASPDQSTNTKEIMETSDQSITTSSNPARQTRRMKHTSDDENEIPLQNMCPSVQDELKLMRLMTSEDIAKRCMNSGYQITVNDLTITPSNDSIDDYTNVASVEEHFTAEAWEKIERLVKSTLESKCETSNVASTEEFSLHSHSDCADGSCWKW